MEETSHRHDISRQNTHTHKINHNKKLTCHLVLYRKYLPTNLNIKKKIGMCISLIGKEVHQLCNCPSLRCHSVSDLMLACVAGFCVEVCLQPILSSSAALASDHRVCSYSGPSALNAAPLHLHLQSPSMHFLPLLPHPFIQACIPLV